MVGHSGLYSIGRYGGDMCITKFAPENDGILSLSERDCGDSNPPGQFVNVVILIWREKK